MVTAGTADLPVADECVATLAANGLVPRVITDVGVAGLHRLLASIDDIVSADAVVVVAGMEGALASVVGGLTAAPVVAVPTSVGYGASLEGVTALLAMLSSCAAGRHGGRHRQRLRRGVRRAADARLGRRRIGHVGSVAEHTVATSATTPCPRAAVAVADAGPGDEIVVPTAVTVAWFHCFSGIAGDMAMGSLVDAGADLDEVRNLCERLPVGGWALEAESVLRTGIGGTKIHVLAQPSTVVRTAAHIAGLVEEARLPERVRRRALATFSLLAEVEGHLHRRPPEQVHFHEVGGIDAIIDVVGTCAALEVLGVDEICASAVANGIGMVRNAHGLMPNPVPAVVELLRGAPTYSLDVAMELTTPTGAALLAANGVGWGPMPAMRIERSGFGAGTAELGDRPNLTQVVIGERDRGDR